MSLFCPICRSSGKPLILSIHLLRAQHRREISYIGKVIKNKYSFRRESAGTLSFTDEFEQKRNQARHSILFSLQNKDDVQLLTTHLSSLKCSPQNVVMLEHYEDESPTQTSKLFNWAIIEFSDKNKCKTVLDNSGHFTNQEKVPIISRYLHFIPLARRSPLNKQMPSYPARIPSQQQVVQISDLNSLKSLSEQIQYIYETQRMDDVGSRLRFFTCSYVEDTIRGLFTNCRATPFGSCVNGLGTQRSDLDIHLDLCVGAKEIVFNAHLHQMAFMTKKFSVERSFHIRNLELIGGMLYNWVPQCTDVSVIKTARVPIVKFTFAHHLQCDISFSSSLAFVMSEVVWLWANSNRNYAPLVHSVVHWMKSNGLCYSAPGPWCSKFIVSMLVAFFLQLSNKLPTVNALLPLMKSTEQTNQNQAVLSVPKLHIFEPDDSGALFKAFLHFLGTVDFQSHGMSLSEGKLYPRQSYDPVELPNPTEPMVNICRILSDDNYVVNMQRTALESLKRLESNQSPKHRHNWGLSTILPLV